MVVAPFGGNLNEDASWSRVDARDRAGNRMVRSDKRAVVVYARRDG
jgi:hypothetical protein